MYKSILEIRNLFINFFYKNNHTIINSSSLIPKNDSTLLFTNSGMNQFKNIFLGLEKYKSTNVVTCQRCVRIGGKYNDLNNIGISTRHNTFFEMLGNFSFGNYFKYEAINFAWEFLTNNNWLNLNKDKFLITVYFSDNESYKIWKNDIGINKNKIILIGNDSKYLYKSDNFWCMGDTGPCGPCSEIFYDTKDNIIDNTKNNKIIYKNRYIEIWNLVFMQYNKLQNGKLISLQKPMIDTGMGLERISSIIQHTNSNYKIDLFIKLINSISLKLNISKKNKEILIISDHIRTCIFLINDGIFPSNEGRGYVLRKIIRRAMRYGYKLGIKDIFLYKLVDLVINIMNEYYVNYIFNKNIITNIILTEEELFLKTLNNGLIILYKKLNLIKNNILDGKTAFFLYDTYGFPYELTVDVCKEYSLLVDKIGFDKCMEQQKNKSNISNMFNFDYNNLLKLKLKNYKTIFVGYDNLKCNGQIKFLFKKNISVDYMVKGDNGFIILNKTSFYAESGGQIGDSGKLLSHNGIFKVYNTKKYGESYIHIGKVISGKIIISMILQAEINKHKRKMISLNHTSTHLLNSALKKILGKHIIQKGSYINDKYLRFDFFHKSALNNYEIILIENMVNQQIRKNLLININIKNINDIDKKLLISNFNYNINDQLRLITINNFSLELCCGTHVNRTGEIGLFSIISECATSSGIRRITAYTGKYALSFLRLKSTILDKIIYLVKGNINTVEKKVKNLQDEIYQLKKNIKQINEKKNNEIIKSLILKKNKINNISIIIKKLNNINIKNINFIIKNLKNKLNNCIILIVSNIDQNIHFTIHVSINLVKYIDAKQISYFFSNLIGAKSGGTKELARGGGGKYSLIPIALVKVTKFIKNKIFII